jgi:hypothetical protein
MAETFDYSKFKRPHTMTGADLLAAHDDDPKPVPPDPEQWRAFENADLEGRWRILAARQPTLADVLDAAMSVRDPGDTD